MTTLQAFGATIHSAAVGQYPIQSGDGATVLIKNVGEITVYLGVVDTNDPDDRVDYQAGYPIRPGEEVKVPGINGSTGQRLAFNTAVNQDSGWLRILIFQEA